MEDYGSFGGASAGTDPNLTPHGGFAPWQVKKQIDQMLATYKNPTTGFGGFGYSPAGANLLPSHLAHGYQQAAGFIMGGSQGAQEQMRQQYEAMLRSRTSGAGAAYGNAMQRGGASLSGMGVSSPLMSLLMGGQRSNLLSQMGAGLGQDEAQYHSALAELIKGTGTELAGLKTKEVGDILNYKVGKATADAAKPNWQTQAIQGLTALTGMKTAFGSNQ